ncbi:MAG TPA: ABC transporter permease subunit [Microthrixaceae bacterium]|nr:ABC transporter permease subunit [Microthrixaceae bacterium]
MSQHAQSTTNGSSAGRRWWWAALDVAISAGVILAAWSLFLAVFDVDHFVGRTPADVWDYLVGAPDAAAHRSDLATAAGITLRDALVGLVCGMAIAVLVAAACQLRPVLDGAVTPLAVAVQAVPLVALTPLIAVTFGRGLLTTTIVTGIVAFFPTLVNVNLGLRSTPRAALDVLAAAGASRTTTLRLARLPATVPALTTSLRIAAPLSLVGALLAEWLVTDEGLGHVMLTSSVTFEFDQLWAAAAVATLIALILYAVSTTIDAWARRRYG